MGECALWGQAPSHHLCPSHLTAHSHPHHPPHALAQPRPIPHLISHPISTPIPTHRPPHHPPHAPLRRVASAPPEPSAGGATVRFTVHIAHPAPPLPHRPGAAHGARIDPRAHPHATATAGQPPAGRVSGVVSAGRAGVAGVLPGKPGWMR